MFGYAASAPSGSSPWPNRCRVGHRVLPADSPGATSDNGRSAVAQRPRRSRTNMAEHRARPHGTTSGAVRGGGPAPRSDAAVCPAAADRAGPAWPPAPGPRWPGPAVTLPAVTLPGVALPGCPGCPRCPPAQTGRTVMAAVSTGHRRDRRHRGHHRSDPGRAAAAGRPAAGPRPEAAAPAVAAFALPGGQPPAPAPASAPATGAELARVTVAPIPAPVVAPVPRRVSRSGPRRIPPPWTCPLPSP